MSELSQHRILVVDDHHIIRAGLTSALLNDGWSDISQANSLGVASDLITKESFSLILTDQYLGDGEGLALAEIAIRVNPNVKLALFTFESNWALIERARVCGFSLFISKECSLSTLLTAVEEVMHTRGGLAIHSPALPGRNALLSPLSKSEIEVLSLLSQGLTAREISLLRYNSEATIKSHLASIYRKLECRNRVEAIKKARDLSLIATR